jgi:acyl-CoA reductase-like NAD-dependent aldehyde dehydrogenase
VPNKRVLTSLEGKSSLVIYDSADFDSAIETIVDGCFYSNGQVGKIKIFPK